MTATAGIHRLLTDCAQLPMLRDVALDVVVKLI